MWNVSWLRKLDANMGKMFKIYLCGDKIYGCSTCRTHLAKHDQIVSKVRGRSHRLLGVLVLDGRGAGSPLTCISILHSHIWRVKNN